MPKNQYRFFVEDKLNIGEICSIDTTLKHQLFNVLRLKSGDKISLVSNKKEFLCEIIDRDTFKVLGNITCDTEAPVKLTLGVSMPKKDKLELILQKSTELGVYDFVVFNSDNTVKTLDKETFLKNLPRYNKIITEACEQSLRLHTPSVNFEDISKIVFKNFDLVIALELDSESKPLHTYLSKEYKSILLLVGCEGGFSYKEIEFFKANNIKLASMAKRILRAETAAIAASHNVIYNYEMEN